MNSNENSGVPELRNKAASSLQELRELVASTHDFRDWTNKVQFEDHPNAPLHSSELLQFQRKNYSENIQLNSLASSFLDVVSGKAEPNQLRLLNTLTDQELREVVGYVAPIISIPEPHALTAEQNALEKFSAGLNSIKPYPKDIPYPISDDHGFGSDDAWEINQNRAHAKKYETLLQDLHERTDTLLKEEMTPLDKTLDYIKQKGKILGISGAETDQVGNAPHYGMMNFDKSSRSPA